MHLAKAAIVAVAISSVAGQEGARTTAIYADALLDVRDGRRVQNAVVVVTGQRIVYAGPASEAKARVPAAAARMDLGNVTLLPGLIDAHVHLSLAGAPEANARATVEAGFTTVQDLGAVDDRILELRDAIDAGRVVGPRVLAAGRWIGVKDGTCEFGGLGIHGAAAFRERVGEEVRRGADVIKVCVSGWLADARKAPERYEIADDELEAAIATAHRLKRRVAVHAISTAGIDVAVRLGADLIVHGGFVSRAAVAAMRARPIYLLPTLFSFSRPPVADDGVALQTHLRASIAAGLPVAFGTDAAVIAHGRNAREFESLRDLGLAPLDAVRTATLHAAAAVGLSGDVGVLAPKASADVIAIDGDPLRDVAALQRVVFVMSRGAIVKRPPGPAAVQ